jgi:hypothetical protein
MKIITNWRKMSNDFLWVLSSLRGGGKNGNKKEKAKDKFCASKTGKKEAEIEPILSLRSTIEEIKGETLAVAEAKCLRIDVALTEKKLDKPIIGKSF